MHTASKSFCFTSLQGEEITVQKGDTVKLEEIENAKPGAPSVFLVKVDESTYEVDKSMYHCIEEKIH